MKAVRKSRLRQLVRWGAVPIFALLMLGTIAWRDTMSSPQVRRTTVSLPGLVSSERSVTVLLLSDLHVVGPDMPPERLARIVAQANRLNPDIVLLAGDFISDKRTATGYYAYRTALAPLARLRPRLGSVAVLGNHDHWRDPTEARQQLAARGVRVLNNSALRLGPLTIGGLDDDFTGHADSERTLAEMRRLGPPFAVLSHSPDPFPDLPRDMPLMLAGHTHCGQIRYPWGGAITTMSRYDDRYACGRIDENGRTLIVSAGLGTSVLPIRFGAPPDMWLITLQPPTQKGARTEVRTPFVS